VRSLAPTKAGGKRRVVADIAKLSVGREEYYTRELATDHQAYLSGHGESPGRWYGAGATSLGLQGEASVAGFQAMLEVHPWEDGPLHGARFDQDTWVAGFEGVLRSGPASGYTQTRFLAQMEWALVDLPGIDDMIEFEARVNYVVPKYEDPVICAYDLSKFGASTVMYALRTHPVVIIGGLLQENPFYVDPDAFLREIREQRPASVGTPIAH
jgi:hypothetical protein